MRDDGGGSGYSWNAAWLTLGTEPTRGVELAGKDGEPLLSLALVQAELAQLVHLAVPRSPKRFLQR